MPNVYWHPSDEDPFDETPEYKYILFGDDSTRDDHAQNLFIEAYFHKDERAYLDLVEYMADEYNIDWEASFDWADVRDVITP